MGFDGENHTNLSCRFRDLEMKSSAVSSFLPAFVDGSKQKMIRQGGRLYKEEGWELGTAGRRPTLDGVFLAFGDVIRDVLGPLGTLMIHGIGDRKIQVGFFLDIKFQVNLILLILLSVIHKFNGFI